VTEVHSGQIDMIGHDRSASVDDVCPSKGRAYRPASEKRRSSNAGWASRRPDAEPRRDLSQVWIKSGRDDDEPVSTGKSPDQLRMNSLHPTAFVHIAGNNGYDRASVRPRHHNSIFRHRVHPIHAMRYPTPAPQGIALLPVAGSLSPSYPTGLEADLVLSLLDMCEPIGL
jgi:hypothetical protein